MSRVPWTEIELKVLRDNYPDSLTADIARALGRPVGQVYQQAARLGLSKSAAFYASEQAHRLDGKKGAGTRFAKGHKTWNAGMKGLQIGGEATQFKPGHVGGMAAKLYQPIGAERVRGGYLYRKMRDTGPTHLRWDLVHRINWEAAYGPIPDGHVIVFRNGNCLDVAVDNLELLSRQQLVARNTIHRYPPELKALIRLNAKIRRNIDEHQQ
jgi:hypothetical protein